MLKAYKYRIYPNKMQQEMLDKHFGCVRYIYNWALEHKSSKYEFENNNISVFDLIKLIPILKLHHPWLREVNSQSLQQAVRNLGIAYKNFFSKRAKFPKFKSKHSRQTFKVPQSVTVDFKHGKISIPKVKEIKAKLHRELPGIIKSATVSKTSTGKYYISILVDDSKPTPSKTKIDTKTTIGIDLGIKNFAVLSTGEIIANPKHLTKTETKLKRAQRKLSRKAKGSANRAKARIKVALLHEKIANQRKDFLHKLSSKLIGENQAIVIEDLNVSGLLKNRKLSKAILDTSWRTFRSYLEYKAEWYGKNLIVINRFDPSSKLCSNCGTINKDLQLKDRSWRCSCGAIHDRDLNAANNIKTFGLNRAGTVRFKACGENVRPSLNFNEGCLCETRSRYL